jgi:DNA polymerase-1
MPDDLKPQIQVVKDVVSSLNIPIFEVPGYEADDLIGTLALQASESDGRQPAKDEQVATVIVTGDRDAFQLVDDLTHVWMPGRGKGSIDTEYDRQGVYEKMGVYPEQITDLKALMGDSSDNIPGVKGIGEKTAIKLVTEFHTVEELYAGLEAGTAQAQLSPAIVTKLQADKDNALLSKVLATIDRHVPIILDLPACEVTTYEKPAATELFIKLDFRSLLPLLPQDEFELGVQSALF